MKCNGILRIHKYVDSQGRYYRIAYFNGQQRFVHFVSATASIQNGLRLRQNRKGKSYIEYTGEFIITKKGVILI